eukprot:gene39594-52219_t
MGQSLLNVFKDKNHVQHRIEVDIEVQPATIDIKRRIRILVVDDAPMNRKMLMRLLQSRGFTTIDEAVDGAAAVTKVTSAMTSDQPY